MIGIYLTHPQVTIEPSIPVPDWPLSPFGRRRVEVLLAKPWLARMGRIVSSAERKAVETASIIGAAFGIRVEQRREMGENDRSATGFLEPAAFEAAADRFFAAPDESWQGWETARHASERMDAAVRDVLGGHDTKTAVLLVGHGAVGTLLKCRMAGRPISRGEDQPAGGGNIFAFGLENRALLCDWTPMELFEGNAHA